MCYVENTTQISCIVQGHPFIFTTIININLAMPRQTLLLPYSNVICQEITLLGFGGKKSSTSIYVTGKYYYIEFDHHRHRHDHHHHHHSVLLKGKSFRANSGTKTTVLPKGSSSTVNSGTKVAVLLGMNRCGRVLTIFDIQTCYIRVRKYASLM